MLKAHKSSKLIGDIMLVEGLSLITAFTNAVSIVLVSKGLVDSDASSASLLSTFIQTSFLSGLLLLDLPDFNGVAIVYFALSGVFSLGLGRLLYFVSVGHLGVAISSAIIGVNPLITTFLAIILLRENVALATFIGTILVVTGIATLSGAERGSTRSRLLVIPLLSALSYSLGNVVRKVGINVQPAPLLGAQVGAAAGMLSTLIYMATVRKLGEIKASRKSL